MIFVLSCLAYFTQHNVSKVYPCGSMYQKIISFQDNNTPFTLLSTAAIFKKRWKWAKGRSFEESDRYRVGSRCEGSWKKEKFWNRGNSVAQRPEARKRLASFQDLEEDSMVGHGERKGVGLFRWGEDLGSGQIRQGHVHHCSVFTFYAEYKGNTLKVFIF